MEITIPQLQAIQPDAILGGYAMEIRQPGLIYDKMFPSAVPGPYTIKVFNWGAQGLKPLVGTLITGKTTEFARFGIDLPSTGEFSVEPHAFSTPLDVFTNAKASEVPTGAIDLEAVKVRTLKRQWDTTKETFARGILASSAVFDVANTTALTSTAKWSHDDSDPVKAVLDMKETIALRTGLVPNKMKIDLSILNRLRVHPKIKTLLPANQEGLATHNQIAALFELDEIVVSSAIENVAERKKADTLSWLWTSGEAILYYEAPVIDQETNTFAASFPWSGWSSLQFFRMEKNQLLYEIVGVEVLRMVVVNRLCAQKFTGVL